MTTTKSRWLGDRAATGRLGRPVPGAVPAAGYQGRGAPHARHVRPGRGAARGGSGLGGVHVTSHHGLLRLHIHARHADATRSQFRYGSSGSHYHAAQRCARRRDHRDVRQPNPGDPGTGVGPASGHRGHHHRVRGRGELMALLLRRLHPLVAPSGRAGTRSPDRPYGTARSYWPSWPAPTSCRTAGGDHRPRARAATEPAEARTLDDRLVQVHLDAGMNDSPVGGDTITPDAAARVLLA